jgi:hypothetical protein
MFENLKMALAFADPDGSDAYDNWDDTSTLRDMKDTTSACCCGNTSIRYVSTIKHKKTQDTMEIGSKCIGKFSPKMKSAAQKRVRRLHGLQAGNKYCRICDRKITGDEDQTVCGACIKRLDVEREKRTRARNFVFKYGKYKGSSIGDLLKTPDGISYITFLYKKPKGMIREIIKKAIVKLPKIEDAASCVLKE